jgi:predicted RNase H-like HicB family nuclease
MTFTVEYEQEDDGRWLAEVIELPGVLAYGETSDEAIAKAQALALRLCGRLEQGEVLRVVPSLSLRHGQWSSASEARSCRPHWLEHQANPAHKISVPVGPMWFRLS